MKFSWGKTFVLGFGFLAISTVWPLYDAYMPDFLSRYIASSAIVGAIMGLDNFLGLTLQPYIGSLSDRTRSRFGRRRPFLLVGMPIAALALAMFPLSLQGGLITLLITTGVLNLSMAIFRSPTVALMPDITPSQFRSQANGVINFMGGVGAALIIQVGKMLYPINPGLPFVAAAGIMVFVFFLFLTIIREPETPPVTDEADETPHSLLAALKQIVQNPDRNTLTLFLAIFTWFVAYQSVNTWFTRYAVENLGVQVHEAAGALFFTAVFFVLGALPAGFVGSKIGRRLTISIGLGGLVLTFISMNFLTSLGQLSIALGAAGLFWAFVNINSYPMVTEMCHPSQIGTYTGLYYIFSGLAGATGPFLAGILFDTVASKRPLFIFGMAFMALALALIWTVRKGEADVKRT